MSKGFLVGKIELLVAKIKTLENKKSPLMEALFLFIEAINYNLINSPLTVLYEVYFNQLLTVGC